LFGRWLLVLSLSLAAASSAHAQVQSQVHPDLTGIWQLNLDKSDYGDMHGPDIRTDVLVQRGDRITDSVTAEGRRRKQQYTLDFATDGSETPLPPQMRMDTALLLGVSGHWQGDALIVTERLTFQGAPLVAISTYILGADGNTLTIALSFRGDSQPAATFVFDRIRTGGRIDRH
jgi:hypothetical protein